MTTSERKRTDTVTLEFPSLPENVGFARGTAALYASRLHFTLDEIDEIKVATSEAVSNVVIHAYKNSAGLIVMKMSIENGSFLISVHDQGCGIEDIAWARTPTHTTLPGEHMGLGFVFMEEYMDELAVVSEPGKGTTVMMKKRLILPSEAGYSRMAGGH